MKHLFLTLFGTMMVLSGMAWGQKGHDTTCAIAQQHLTPKAQARISSLLEGKSIVYWSNWLDNAVHTPEYAYAKTWHYKNIDADQTYDTAPTLEAGDVVTALTSLVAELKGYESKHSDANREKEALALKMLVHLMGDLHQPMHLGRKSDLGGNRHNVQYFRIKTNLHGIWDANLVESAHAWSHTEWVEEIDRTSAEERKQMAEGSIDDWARETHAIATAVYEDTPVDAQLSYDYIAKWTPTIEQQFLRGGVRLAHLLNEIFRK